MSHIVNLVISLLIAAVAAAVTAMVMETPTLPLFAAFSIATVATALLVSLAARSTAVRSSSSSGPAGTRREPTPTAAKATASSSNDAPRQQGQVKWFNSSKGFGFITLDDGEEIFVHFRSILGDGRRGLRDGQRVSFVVAQSDKGPQAEEVEALD